MALLRRYSLVLAVVAGLRKGRRDRIGSFFSHRLRLPDRRIVRSCFAKSARYCISFAHYFLRLQNLVLSNLQKIRKRVAVPDFFACKGYSGGYAGAGAGAGAGAEVWCVFSWGIAWFRVCLPVFYFRRVSALARSPSLVAFVLLQCSPGLHVGNLQAARVAAKPLPRFMYGYAARAAVAAIRAALPVSAAWLGLHFRNVGGIVL